VTALIERYVSSTSALLSLLQSYLVSTLGWTLIDTNVSGLAENFVVRSSGTSGNRLICLKFGASTAAQTTSGLSCFACVSFASATDVASNPTSERSLTTNGASPMAVWVAGDLDHVQLATDRGAAAASACWIYLGLVDEFVSSVAQTPNQVLVGNAHDWDAVTARARLVESPSGTFDTAVHLRALVGLNVLPPQQAGGPNLNDGYCYLWPVLVVNGSTDRVYGALKNTFAVAQGLSGGQQLVNISCVYACLPTVNTTGTPRASVGMRVA